MHIVIIIIVIIVIVALSNRREGFANKREKANKIFEWFKDNPTPKYNNYKSYFGGKSDILEYEDALKLREKNKFNPQNIVNIVSL